MNIVLVLVLVPVVIVVSVSMVTPVVVAAVVLAILAIALTVVLILALLALALLALALLRALLLRGRLRLLLRLRPEDRLGEQVDQEGQHRAQKDAAQIVHRKQTREQDPREDRDVDRRHALVLLSQGSCLPVAPRPAGLRRIDFLSMEYYISKS